MKPSRHQMIEGASLLLHWWNAYCKSGWTTKSSLQIQRSHHQDPLRRRNIYGVRLSESLGYPPQYNVFLFQHSTSKFTDFTFLYGWIKFSCICDTFIIINWQTSRLIAFPYLCEKCISDHVCTGISGRGYGPLSVRWNLKVIFIYLCISKSNENVSITY